MAGIFFVLFHYNTCMLLTILFFALGIVGAGLVNYLSDVLPGSRKLTSPTCLACQEKLDWLSYLSYSACSACGARPSKRHWSVLITLPVLALVLRYLPLPVFGLWGGILWLVYFSVIVVIDLEHRLILHPVSLTGAILGLIFGMRAHGLLNTLIGAAAGFGIMLLFYFLGELFIRVLSKRRGEEIQEVALGFGDVNLAGVMGALLGWPGVVGGIFLAVLFGGVVSGLFLVIQVLRKEYQAYQALPYGPFLVISVFFLLYISQITG